MNIFHLIFGDKIYICYFEKKKKKKKKKKNMSSEKVVQEDRSELLQKVPASYHL